MAKQKGLTLFFFPLNRWKFDLTQVTLTYQVLGIFYKKSRIVVLIKQQYYILKKVRIAL